MRGLTALILVVAVPAACAQSLPTYLKPMPGSATGKPYRVVVNGEASIFVNASVEQPLDRVVAHYRKALSAESALAGLPPETQRERGLEEGLTFQRAAGYVMVGMVDREGRTTGVVAFADPDPRTKRTQYYLSVSEGKTPMRGIDPRGDAPGRDPEDIPRAEGLRRVFSIERYDPGLSTTHVYEGAVDPGEVARHYREALPSLGWRTETAVAEEFPAGNIQAFTAGERNCRIMVSQDAAGCTHVTILVTAPPR